jgi:hypothetical protein
MQKKSGTALRPISDGACLRTHERHEIYAAYTRGANNAMQVAKTHVQNQLVQAE